MDSAPPAADGGTDCSGSQLWLSLSVRPAPSPVSPRICQTPPLLPSCPVSVPAASPDPVFVFTSPVLFSLSPFPVPVLRTSISCLSPVLLSPSPVDVPSSPPPPECASLSSQRVLRPCLPLSSQSSLATCCLSVVRNMWSKQPGAASRGMIIPP